MKKIIFLTVHFLLKSIRLFYTWIYGGQKCVVCGEKTYIYPVCKKCTEIYFNVEKKLSVPRCKICGKELTSTFDKCTNCKENPVLMNIDKSIPLFSYRLWNKELLFMWKISGIRSLSEFYASLLNKALTYLDIKFIVPVPPRKGKIQKNGWDQIDELCKILKYRYDYIILKLLERNSTQQQKKLNREERLMTMKNAYSLSDYSGVYPEKVCIIDDVCTTGSTIECCASLLKSVCIKEVFCVTLFIVD